jgi:hypothetical protein
MMNPHTLHIQKREIVDLQKTKDKYKPEKKNLGPFNLIKKCLSTKVFVIVEQSSSPITAKSADGVVI